MTLLHRIRAADGLSLAVFEDGPAGDGGGVPVLCLPGLTRNAADFVAFSRYLCARAAGARRVLRLDLRGRGASDRDPQGNYTVVTETADVLSVLDALAIPQADVVGTSRGGIVAMSLAVTAPARLRRAVLVDVGAVIPGPALHALGRGLARLTPVPSLDAAAALIREVQGTAFTRTPEAAWTGIARALYRANGAGFVLDADPRIAASVTALPPDGPDVDLTTLFDGLAGKRVLAVRGALSDILPRSVLDAMRARKPDLQVIEVPNEGHAPRLADTATLEAIAGFLEG